MVWYMIYHPIYIYMYEVLIDLNMVICPSAHLPTYIINLCDKRSTYGKREYVDFKLHAG